MNMEVSNEELHELLTKFMKRLDKMEKERDVMKNKLDMMHAHIKDVNKALDEVYFAMSEGEGPLESLTEEEIEHVKNIGVLIQDEQVDFLDDDEFKVLIHSVVGES